jgi:hypothetical protein
VNQEQDDSGWTQPDERLTYRAVIAQLLWEYGAITGKMSARIPASALREARLNPATVTEQKDGSVVVTQGDWS